MIPRPLQGLAVWIATLTLSCPAADQPNIVWLNIGDLDDTLGCLIFAVTLPGPAEPKVSMQTLFEKPKSEGEFRIPGLLRLNDGTLLAFCADRKGRGDFGHDTTNVVRRSTDGGKTWGPIQEIAAQAGADIHSGPAVQDRDSGRVFKFMRYWPAAKDAKQFTNTKTYREMVELGWIDHVQVSDDSGLTWSDPEPLELDFRGDAVSAATGNGVHGIQLKDGRLLIQGGYSERTDEGRLLRRCCLFASDDGGKSWSRTRDMDTAEIDVIREFVMAERGDGEVVCNLRTKKKWRALSVGREVRLDDELSDVECHAGLTVAKGRWFFTHPNPVGEARNGSFGERRQRMCLRISDDEGATWPKEIEVYSKAAGYSDVAVLEEGTVLVLFENGERIGDSIQRISLARVEF